MWNQQFPNSQYNPMDFSYQQQQYYSQLQQQGPPSYLSSTAAEEPLNWELVKSLDPSLLRKNNDLTSLQPFINDYIVADFENCNSRLITHPLLLRLCQVLQYSLFYMSDVQKQLQKKVEMREKEIKGIKAKYNDLEDKYKKALHIVKKRKQEFERCPICRKKYKSLEYLDKHFEKNHPVFNNAWLEIRSLKRQDGDQQLNHVEQSQNSSFGFSSAESSIISEKKHKHKHHNDGKSENHNQQQKGKSDLQKLIEMYSELKAELQRERKNREEERDKNKRKKHDENVRNLADKLSETHHLIQEAEDREDEMDMTIHDELNRSLTLATDDLNASWIAWEEQSRVLSPIQPVSHRNNHMSDSPNKGNQNNVNNNNKKDEKGGFKLLKPPKIESQNENANNNNNKGNDNVQWGTRPPTPLPEVVVPVQTKPSPSRVVSKEKRNPNRVPLILPSQPFDDPNPFSNKKPNDNDNSENSPSQSKSSSKSSKKQIMSDAKKLISSTNSTNNKEINEELIGRVATELHNQVRKTLDELYNSQEINPAQNARRVLASDYVEDKEYERINKQIKQELHDDFPLPDSTSLLNPYDISVCNDDNDSQVQQQRSLMLDDETFDQDVIGFGLPPQEEKMNESRNDSDNDIPKPIFNDVPVEEFQQNDSNKSTGENSFNDDEIEAADDEDVDNVSSANVSKSKVSDFFVAPKKQETKPNTSKYDQNYDQNVTKTFIDNDDISHSKFDQSDIPISHPTKSSKEEVVSSKDEIDRNEETIEEEDEEEEDYYYYTEEEEEEEKADKPTDQNQPNPNDAKEEPKTDQKAAKIAAMFNNKSSFQISDSGEKIVQQQPQQTKLSLNPFGANVSIAPQVNNRYDIYPVGLDYFKAKQDIEEEDDEDPHISDYEVVDEEERKQNIIDEFNKPIQPKVTPTFMENDETGDGVLQFAPIPVITEHHHSDDDDENFFSAGAFN